jgi:hypothetical protein
MNTNIKTFDQENQEMCNAYDLIARTNKSFFLTGRAGTGKTTFLQEVQKCVHKNFIVLAPSGVAAIHAGGQTIHSFFGFSLGVQGPLDMGQMNANKIAAVQQIDTIIIDEVSMVRCDYIDAIDRMLRYCKHSSQPFGGIQMVFVGDMFQLLPIATKDDQEVLRRIYGQGGIYFFNARCLEGRVLPKIEFKKIYRQNDPEFIQILEHFRTGSVTVPDLERINSRVVSIFDKKDEDLRITLTAYRNDAQVINQQRLADLPGDSIKYEASYEGNVTKFKDVVDDTLELKKGAQVMFLRNDVYGRWANGTIARVAGLDEQGVIVQIEGKGEELFPVEPQTWEAYDYQYDETEKTCKKQVVGTVTQFPLRLAWAITIHKSQSLTFDKVDVDFGRGAFTYGQTYVALSRARSLAGLRLLAPLHSNSVRVSRDVQSFAASYNDEEIIATELAVGEAVLDFEQKHDYDGAATRLFAMCKEAAHQGRGGYATKLLDQALSYLADDSCLFGQEWEPLPNTSRDNIVLNAAGFLYSGRTEDSLPLLIRTVRAEKGYFNALYMLARAVELTEDWDNVETLYNQMISIFRDTYGNGLDSPAFRKFKYRLAVLNESHYGDTGFDIIAKLIAENPYYDRYHADLRWMLQKRSEELAYKPDEERPLVNMLMDPAVTEDQFLEQLRVDRSERNASWETYRNWVSHLRSTGNQ